MQLLDGRSLKLHILLPPGFPSTAPSLSLSHWTADMSHEWVDNHGNIDKCPYLCADAGDLCGPSFKAVLEYLQQTPPSVSSELPMYSPPIASSAYTGAQSRPEYGNDSGPAIITIEIPELDELDMEQLQALSDDAGEYKRFFEELPQVVVAKNEIQKLRNENLELARQNLAREHPLKEQRDELIALHSRHADLKGRYEASRRELDGLQKQFSWANVLTQLESSCISAKVESTRIQEEFSEGRLGLKEFIDRYQAAKTVEHARQFKLEEFKKLRQ